MSISEGIIFGVKKLNNVTTVQNIRDLPTPSSGAITMNTGVLYLINGQVDLEGNRIITNGMSGIIGMSAEHDGLIYNGVGTLFTTGAGENLTLRNIGIDCDDGEMCHVTGDGNNIVNFAVNCDFNGINDLGRISGIRFMGMTDSFYGFCGDGFKFSGANNSRIIMRGNTLLNNDGTFFNLGTSVWGNVLVTENQSIATDSGGTFLSGSALSANITNGAVVSGNIFSGTGTYLDTVTNNDLKWEFQGNKGEKGTEDSQRDAETYVSTPAVTTISVGDGDSGNPKKINGTFSEVGVRRFTTDSTGRITYIGLEPYDGKVTIAINIDPSSGANKIVDVCIALNGTPVSSSAMEANLDNNSAQVMIVQALITFSTDDYVEAFIENTTDTTNMTAQKMTVIVN